MPPRPKAYSYVRFSTPDQLKGDSVRRQAERAALYATKHDLEIDDRLSFSDYGVSAFQGRNEATGRLGEFLSAIEHGDIAPGSYLLVESLDRLSRQKPRRAVRLLERICEAGISVVTLTDERVYTIDTLDEDPMALLIAILVASRANEESETKAKRLTAAWEAKRQKAASRPMTSICPAWLKLSEDRSAFEIIQDRAEIVRRVFRETLEGHGQHAIAQRLNREGVPVFGRGQHWHRSYVAKILKNEAVIGWFTPHTVQRINGKKVRVKTNAIDGYFPVIVDPETFERVASMSSGRAAAKSSGLSNILAGLAVCPRCGSTMTRVNKGSGKKAGKPYLVCTRAKSGAGCQYRQVRQEKIESAILDRVEELYFTLPSPENGLQQRWEELLRASDYLSTKIETLSAAIADAGHSKALLDRLRSAENQLWETDSERHLVEEKIAATLTNRVVNTVDELVALCRSHPPDIGAINATFRQLFESVEVDYAQGKLRFAWQHAEDISEISYALPEFEEGALVTSQ